MSGEISGHTILVVEDEPLLGMLLEDVLSDAGATVIGPAATVEQALALIGASSIDAAILDVNLRGVRSDAVATELAHKGVPYLFATAYGETVLGAAPGAPVLRKPYDLAEVMAALRRLLTH